MCSTFNSILNLASSEDSMDIDPPPAPAPPRPQVLLHIPTTALFNQLRAALVAMDSNNNAMFDALSLNEEQQNGLIALLQEAAANVEAEQLQQDNAIEVLQGVTSSMEAEQLVQNSAIAVLQDGFLPRVHYEEEGLGGAHLVLTPDNGGGSSATLQTYDATGKIGASIELKGNLISMSEKVRITGDLLLGDSENTVQAQLDDLEERILQEVIALASNYTLDFVQQGLISALSLLLKPKGFEALPDIPDDEDFPDSNSIPPIRCFPAGKFTDELPDELGNAVERINSKGKITISADVLPTRTVTVGGDVLFLKEDEDDEFECQYTCRLGSKVAVLDAELQLTNPDAVVCRLGGNALVTAAGAVNAESLVVGALTTGKVNGISTNKLVQRYAPSVDVQLNKRVAKVSDTALAARRAVGKPVLNKSYDDHVARLHAELLDVKRAAYSKTLAVNKSFYEDVARLHAELLAFKRVYSRPVLSKSYDDDIARVRADTQALQRGAYTKPVLAKDWSSDIAALKQRPINSSSGRQAITLPVRDSTRAIKAVRDATTAIQNYTAPLSTSTAAAAKVVGTLSVSGLTTLAAGLTVSTGTTSLGGALNVTGKLIKLASDTDGGAVLNGAGLQVGFDILEPNNLLFNNGAWLSSIRMNLPALGVTGASTLAAVTATTLSATGTSTLASVTATVLSVTGASTLASVTATTLSATGTSTLASVSATILSATGTSTLASVSATTLSATGTSTLASVSATTLSATGNTAINGVLRMGSVGTSTVAGYQGGTIYFNGPAGDSSDAFSGIQCKNYTNGTTSNEATELLLWQLNDPYSDAGPDRVRLYAGEIRFDTYIAAVSAGSQYTESTRMIIMPNGYV
jgi:hypothetical protein